MINLAFYNDMCNWWWLWWLLPFLLGLLLGWAIWAGWKTKYEELEKTIAGYKKTISDLEEALEICKKGRLSLESDLALERGRISELMASIEGQKGTGDGNIAASSITSDSGIKAASLGAIPSAGSIKYAKLKEDNLQVIEGIGPKMNQVLIDNKVTSWSVLAGKSHTELKAILDTYGDKYRIIDPNEWPAQAAYAAKGDWDGLIRYQKQDGSESKAEKLMIKMGIIKAFKENDLKAIEGIGPKIEQILNNSGVTTWRGLANTSVEKLNEILEAAGDRFKLADPETWPKQAEYAAEGKWDDLEKYQDFLDGGRTPS